MRLPLVDVYSLDFFNLAQTKKTFNDTKVSLSTILLGNNETFECQSVYTRISSFCQFSISSSLCRRNHFSMRFQFELCKRTLNSCVCAIGLTDWVGVVATLTCACHVTFTLIGFRDWVGVVATLTCACHVTFTLIGLTDWVGVVATLTCACHVTFTLIGLH